MPITRTPVLRSRQSPFATILVLIAALDITSWALFAVLIHRVRAKYAAHHAALDEWNLAGRPDPTFCARPCNRYPPSPSMSTTLILTLPPLITSAVTVPALLALALQRRLHPVLMLCVAVLSLCLWAPFGIFNVLGSDPYFTEKTELDAIDHMWQAVAALQCVGGAVWLVGMIAAARWVHVHNREKWAARGAEDEAARRVARRVAREIAVVGPPPYAV